ncbi:thermonuclease family protein [Maricaulis sp. CAU 1757]
MRIQVLFALVCGACMACSAPAQPFEAGETGQPGQVTGPLSFVLLETEPSGENDMADLSAASRGGSGSSPVDANSLGLEVRLAALDAPDRERAQIALSEYLSESTTLRLAYDGPRRDRYDRALAQVFLGDEPTARWLQAELVSSGAARVLSHADNRLAVVDLLGLEAEARKRLAGLWGDARYRVRDTHPDGLAQDVGSVQLVEGRVISATRLRSGQMYLNFGTDYRTDFTISVAPEHEDAFDAAGLTPAALETRRVRVRGWLEMQNGPMIRIDHPERIEVLDEDPA